MANCDNVFESAPPALRETIVCAEAETRRLRHGFIGSEHLLLGLLAREGTRAADRLQHASVSHADVSARIVTIVGVGDEDVPHGIVPYTPNAAAVCRLVMRDAETINPETIGSEHVLRALLTRRRSLACHVLRDLRVDRDAFLRQLRRPRADGE